MTDETNVKDSLSIEIIFHGFGSAEYDIKIGTDLTANQVWVVANYLAFIAEQAHHDKRMADMIMKQRQMEEANQKKLFIPDPKLTKPS